MTDEDETDLKELNRHNKNVGSDRVDETFQQRALCKYPLCNAFNRFPVGFKVKPTQSGHTLLSTSNKQTALEGSNYSYKHVLVELKGRRRVHFQQKLSRFGYEIWKNKFLFTCLNF